MRVGCDIVCIDRFEKMDKIEMFLNKYFTISERAYILSKNMSLQTIAGIFAAKESVIKSIGEGISLSEIEIDHTKTNMPTVSLLGNAKIAYPKTIFSVSISHEKEYAMAVTIATCQRDVW